MLTQKIANISANDGDFSDFKQTTIFILVAVVAVVPDLGMLKVLLAYDTFSFFQLGLQLCPELLRVLGVVRRQLDSDAIDSCHPRDVKEDRAISRAEVEERFPLRAFVSCLIRRSPRRRRHRRRHVHHVHNLNHSVHKGGKNGLRAQIATTSLRCDALGVNLLQRFVQASGEEDTIALGERDVAHTAICTTVSIIATANVAA